VAFTVAASPGTELADVRTVAAYPVALRQVQRWLATHLPQASVRSSASNAAAAQDVAQGHADAGVTTALAGTRFGLVTLAESVADYHDATTRFVVVAAPGVPAAATGSDRTSVVFEVPNRPGALLRAFGEFSNRGIDLTMIASRPTRTGIGTYRFHLDCVGHIADDAIGEALQALYRSADWVRFLGSWPAHPVEGRLGPRPPSHDISAEWLAGLREGTT
jgi:prephenate dehydratase